MIGLGLGLGRYKGDREEGRCAGEGLEPTGSCEGDGGRLDVRREGVRGEGGEQRSEAKIGT